MNNLDILESGELFASNAPVNKIKKFEIKILTEKNLSDLPFLQEYGHRVSKEKYLPVTAELERQSVAAGVSVGLFVDNKLVGMNIACKGALQSELAGQLNIPKSELDSSAFNTGTVVHGDYRGNQMGTRLMQHTKNLLCLKNYIHWYSVVHPENFASLSSCFATGLLIKGLDYSYYDNLRTKVYSNLSKLAVPPYPEVTRVVRNTDIKQQQTVLADGYEGFLFLKRDKELYIVYRKFISR